VDRSGPWKNLDNRKLANGYYELICGIDDIEFRVVSESFCVNSPSLQYSNSSGWGWQISRDRTAIVIVIYVCNEAVSVVGKETRRSNHCEI